MSDQTKETNEISPPDKKTIDDEAFYNALSHKIRRDIITIIGDNEKAGFVQFKRQIGASTGAIYHHLDILSDFIYQDKSKKYHLTELGLKAYYFIKQTENQNTNLQNIPPDKKEFLQTEGQQQTELPPKEGSDDISSKNRDDFNIDTGLLKLFWLELLFKKMEKDRKYALLIDTFILGLIALLCGFFNIENYLYFFIFPDSFTSKVNSFYAVPFFGILLGYLSIYLFIEISYKFIFHSGNQEAQTDGAALLRLLPVTYIPSLFYLILMIAFKGKIDVQLRIFIQFIVQIWTIGVLSQVLVRTKKIQPQKALLLAIFLNYFVFIAIIIIKNPVG